MMMHPRVQWAVARAKAAVLLGRAADRAWDESQHPREPAGSSAGGEFTSGGGGNGKGKTPKSAAEFTKDEVYLDNSTVNDPAKQKKFLETWEKNVGEAPAAFKKEFLGSQPGTMNIRYHDHLDAITVTGSLHDAQGNSIGEYTRDIDFDDHRAVSSYFKLHGGETGKNVGKKVLAANVAMYQKMGIDKVSVHANIDVGGYAWAKYGYVPTKSEWLELSEEIDRNIRKMSSGGEGGGYRAGSWDELTDNQQRHIEREFYNQSFEEFRDSEIDSWRESGQALDDAKVELADQFNASVQDWGENAIDGYRKQREEAGKPPIPFDNFTLLDAVSVEYEAGYEGRGDFTVEFDDDKLTQPEGGPDPNQPTLPGIEEVKPHERLTEDMREGIERALSKMFDKEAEDKAADTAPPDYIDDSVREYQRDYWDQLDDREKYAWADRNASDMLGSEDGEEGSGEISDEDANRLQRLTGSDDPKALWAIADSAWGKELLLGTDWSGVLDLKDRETMDRFNAYVGKK